MKMVKSLILGSAAGLVAMSGAQAADLPVKAKAVEYVRICSLYGAGFFYIPGTDTCIKLSGYLRVDVVVNDNSDYTPPLGNPAGNGNRFTNAYTWRSREDFDIDTRTATEYGVVRTFFDATFSWTDDVYTANGTNPLGTVYSQIGALGVGQANNGSSGLVAAGTVGVYYAFIQFAGFTMGKAISPFSAPGFVNYPGNNFDGLVGGGGTVTGVNQFIYTAQFGNGVSGTIGVQDPTQYYQAGNLNFGAFGSAAAFTGTNDIGGTEFPDVVGNILVTQAWGSAQLSAAAHDNRAAYYINTGLASLLGHPDDKWGFAVQGAASINTPSTGAGDVLNIEGVYTDGATRYNIQDLAGGVGAWTSFNNNGSPLGPLGGVGVGFAPDSVFNAFGQQKLIQTWGGRGGFTHNWNPYWNTSIYGAYAHVDYGSVTDAGSAATIVCASLANVASITHCDPNYNIAQAGIITRWTPVKNLTFSGDFTWEHLDQKYTGALATGGNGMPTGLYTLTNQDVYTFLFRAQRNW
jgi:Porin subfamily